MKELVVQNEGWCFAIIDGIREADEETLIVVDSEDKKELVLLTAKHLGKKVKVEVRFAI